MARKRGKVVLPLDSNLWRLSTAALGLLMHLHRAVLLYGDRDSGVISASMVDELAESLGAIDELLKLESKNIIADCGENRVKVTTWNSAQGNEERIQREKSRQRVSLHRERNGNPTPKCNALHDHNYPTTQAQNDNSGAGKCNALQKVGTEEVNNSNIRSYIRSSDPNKLIDILDTVNVSGFIGNDDQGLLLIDTVSRNVLEIAEIWAELEPFKRLKDVQKFIEKLMRSYPEVNLLEESLKIDAWWYANPSKRKTKRGTPKFINSWMSNAQERAITDKRRPSPNTHKDAHASTVDAVWGKGGISD